MRRQVRNSYVSIPLEELEGEGGREGRGSSHSWPAAAESIAIKISAAHSTALLEILYIGSIDSISCRFQRRLAEERISYFIS